MHLTLLVLRLKYTTRTRSISWLLIPWLLTSPWYHQTWYWPYEMCRPMSSIKKDFHHRYHFSAEEWFKIQIRIDLSLKINTKRIKPGQALFGVKPLPESVLTYCHINPTTKLKNFNENSVKIKKLFARKCFWKSRLQNVAHFVHAWLYLVAIITAARYKVTRNCSFCLTMSVWFACQFPYCLYVHSTR